MAVLGIVTCQILELEFAHLLVEDDDISDVYALDTGHSEGFVRAVSQKKESTPIIIKDLVEHQAAPPDKFEVIVHVLELGLHAVIKDLRSTVAKAVFEMGPHVDVIVLGYGLCGNALENHEELMKSVDVPVFMPVDEDHTVDDCIGMIIGGRESYYQEQCNIAGTFFMNAGFSNHWKDLLWNANKTKYDASMSRRIMDGYERSLLLVTPVLSQDEMAANIAEFNRTYGLRTEVRKGTLEILQRTLVRGKQFVMEKTNTSVAECNCTDE